MANDKKVVTPPFRVTFPSLFEKRGFDGPDDPNAKYSVCAVFDPESFGPEESRAWKRLLAIADAAAVEAFKKPLKQLGDGYKKPLRDGADKEHLEGFGPGLVFCNLTTYQRPGVVGRDLQPILDPEEIYPGCYARATVTAYSYNNVGKGVAFGLHNVQKLGEGENLAGRTDPTEDFGDDAPEWGDVPATGGGGGGDADLLG